jgi:hypothetical protein
MGDRNVVFLLTESSDYRPFTLKKKMLAAPRSRFQAREVFFTEGNKIPSPRKGEELVTRSWGI